MSIDAKKYLYFAYGSNMLPEQMRKRLKREIEPVGIAKLEGYRFGYFGHSKNWDLRGTADIVPARPTDAVYGVAYEMTDDDIALLDSFERRYKRVAVMLVIDGCEREGFAYVIKRDGSNPMPEDENEPSDAYRQQCAAAARTMGLDETYIRTYIEG